MPNALTYMDKGALRSEFRTLLERERDKLIAAHKTTSTVASESSSSPRLVPARVSPTTST